MDGPPGSGRKDGRENERMNKTGEKKLETHITVGQRGAHQSKEEREIESGK